MTRVLLCLWQNCTRYIACTIRDLYLFGLFHKLYRNDPEKIAIEIAPTMTMADNREPNR